MGFDPGIHFTAVKHYKLLYDDTWAPDTSKLYCLHCIDEIELGNGWTGEYSVKAHVSSKHGVADRDAERGVDFTDGEGLWLALRAFRSNAEKIADAESKLLRFVLDPDDFLHYCEVGV